MIKNEDTSQASIIARTTDYKPPRSLSHWFIGRPLQTADAPHQTIGKAVGLAVFASDALSSTAYATQEILGVLIVLGPAAYGYVFPVSLVIVGLLTIVTVSYEQTIHAYPGGGGAYIVARDNLGELPAQTAGAALLTDYILTVAVSVASGVAQIVSAYPSLFPYRVLISVIAVLFIMLINLRGVKESGTAFAIPTYFFIVMMLLTVGIGMVRQLSGGLGAVLNPPPIELARPLAGITPFLLLHAFSSGMAANTAFADFPRLGALHAADGFLPRQLTYRGSRLVYSRGIVALAVISCLLIIVFQASVTRLIPLYAIGVFLSFTLSQTGMARRWWRVGHLEPGKEIVDPGSTLRYEKGWQYKMIINGFGAVCTAIVMVVFAVTKFRDGAWIILILVPLLVIIFFAIHHHYKDLAFQLSLEKFSGFPARQTRHRVIVPVSAIHQGALAALRYARILSDDVTAVHVSIDPAETEKVQKKWKTWGEGTRLVILDSPYRLFIEPLVAYIEDIVENSQPNETITIVVPQFIPLKRWHYALHMRTADVLRQELLSKPGVVVTDIPYHVHKEVKA